MPDPSALAVVMVRPFKMHLFFFYVFFREPLFEMDCSLAPEGRWAREAEHNRKRGPDNCNKVKVKAGAQRMNRGRIGVIQTASWRVLELKRCSKKLWADDDIKCLPSWLTLTQLLLFWGVSAASLSLQSNLFDSFSSRLYFVIISH